MCLAVCQQSLSGLPDAWHACIKESENADAAAA
jgi:hypothetical protein